jgi:hypothetical protein
MPKSQIDLITNLIVSIPPQYPTLPANTYFHLHECSTHQLLQPRIFEIKSETSTEFMDKIVYRAKDKNLVWPADGWFDVVWLLL